MCQGPGIKIRKPTFKIDKEMTGNLRWAIYRGDERLSHLGYHFNLKNAVNAYFGGSYD